MSISARSVVVFVLLFGFFVGVAVVPASSRPPVQNRSFHLNVIFPERISEWRELSQVIVEARVQGVMPSMQLDYDRLATDVVFQAQAVLKGDSRLGEFVVAQRGGSLGARTETPEDYSLMEPGERYILFLTPVGPNPQMTPLPVRPGLPRYSFLASHVSAFRISNGSLRLPSALKEKADWSRYEGADPSLLVAELLGSAAPTGR